jgi:hypothetical protein
LEVVSPAWSRWNPGNQEELEKAEQKAVKIVIGLRGDIYKEKCKEQGLQTLKERSLQQDRMPADTFTHAYIHGGSDNASQNSVARENLN